MNSVAIAVLVGFTFTLTPADPPITVFVTTAATTGDFVDVSQDILDSMKDIRKRIDGKKKEMRLVESAAEADVVLRILERRMVTEAYGERITIDTSRTKTGASTTATAAPGTAWAAMVVTELQVD